MRLRCRIADDAPADLTAAVVVIEVDGGRLGVPFARASGVRARRGAGCIVDLDAALAARLREQAAAHPQGARLVVEPIPDAAIGLVTRLTVPGEDRDKHLIEVPTAALADACAARGGAAGAGEAAAACCRALPLGIRQLVVALDGLDQLPLYDPDGPRRRAAPAPIAALVGRAQLLRDAAARMEQQAAALAAGAIPLPDGRSRPVAVAPEPPASPGGA